MSLRKSVSATQPKEKTKIASIGNRKFFGPTKISPLAVFESYKLTDDGVIPNNRFPVLHYRNVLELPVVLPGLFTKRLLEKNGWSNNWTAGIYTYEHYHSTTHEVLAIIKGSTKIRLGGKEGVSVTVRKGDVIIIPAGTAHQNLQEENSVVCVGGYPLGRDFDIKRGKPEDRKTALKNIRNAPFPSKDPVFGPAYGLFSYWQEVKTQPKQSRTPRPAANKKKADRRTASKTAGK